MGGVKLTKRVDPYIPDIECRRNVYRIAENRGDFVPGDSITELFNLGIHEFDWHERAPAMAECDVFNSVSKVGTGPQANTSCPSLVPRNLDKARRNETFLWQPLAALGMGFASSEPLLDLLSAVF